MSRESLRFTDYGYLALIAILFSVVSFYLGLNQIFTYDQMQMLLKGFHAAFTGEYLPFGNEASTMGNLPGQLSSWLIGFPLSLSMNVYSPLIFMIVVRVVAILIFANALSMLFNRTIVVFGTFLYALSPWLLIQGMLFNPAFVPFGAAVILNALVRLRYVRDEKGNGFNRFLCSLMMMLGFGFCMQLHFSWPLLVIMIGTMWLRRDIKVSYLGIIVGILLVAASLIPYVQELSHNPTLTNNPEPYAKERYIGYGFVHVYPIFKGLLYWFRFASLLITKKAIVPEITDDFSTILVVISYAWIGISSLVGGITVLIAVYANYFAIFNFRRGNSSPQLAFVRGFTISSIFAMMFVSGLSTLTFNYWQVAIALPFALIPLLAFLSVRHNFVKPLAVVTAVFYLCAIPLLMLYSNNYNYKSNYQESFYGQCLVGFSAEQCAPFAVGLDPVDAERVRENSKFSQEIYDRVVNGIIPLPGETVEEAKAKIAAKNREVGTTDASAVSESGAAATNAQEGAEGEVSGNADDAGLLQDNEATDSAQMKQEPLVPEGSAEVVAASTAAAATAAASTAAAKTSAKSDAKTSKTNAKSAKSDTKANVSKSTNNDAKDVKVSDTKTVRFTAPEVESGQSVSGSKSVKEAKLKPITASQNVERADAKINLDAPKSNKNNKATKSKIVDKGDGASGELKLR